jgi:M6 family metalloprotease-like protein
LDQLQQLEKLGESEQLVLRHLGPHGVSRKGLARARARRELVSTKGLAAAGVDTLHVLVVLIDFDTDRSGSLTSVTEDGGFSCDPDTSIIFDPPPHDRNFFGAHIEGLGRFWSSMSNGRLVVDARVYPPVDPTSNRNPCNAISLSDIADYGPGSGGFWDIDSLVKLVQDMIKATDEASLDDPSLNLADFDFDNPNTYVIFAHAGGDLQSNLVWDPGVEGYSPNDIPTFFVLLGDSDTVQLQSVDDLTSTQGLMTECSIIPESTTQDGLLGSIAAALYHEFGHSLGLPDLYSTYTGQPGVGWWDLMDSGTNLPANVQLEAGADPVQVTGLLPPSIGLWSKWFLGWIDPIRASAQPQTIDLPASYLQDHDDKGLLLDTGNDEFFLVENRWVPPFVPLDASGIPQWALIRDQASGVVLYLGENTNVVRPENTNLYDFFMPWEGGAMVWRVRQGLIDRRIGTNEVQRLPGDCGLEIVEADGIQDIGVFDFRTLGFVGSGNDAFRAPGVYENPPQQPLYSVGFDSTQTAFGPTTTPSSESALRVPTGAAIWDISRSDTVMTMKAALFASQVSDNSHFPVVLPPVDGAEGPVPLLGDARSVAHVGGLDATSTPEPAILVSATPSDGSPGATVFAFTPQGDSIASGIAASLSGPTAGPIASLPSFRGAAAYALMTVDGSVDVRDADLRNGGGSLSGFPLALGDSITAGPIVVRRGSESLLLGANLPASRLHLVQENGTIRDDWSNWESQGGLGLNPSETLRSVPVAADLDGNGQVESMVFVAGARIVGYDLSGQSPTRVLDLPILGKLGEIGAQSSFALTAWPSEEGLAPDRILVEYSEARSGEPDAILLRVFFRSGRWDSEYFGEGMPLPLTGPAALGDLDGDGHRDVVVMDRDRIWAYGGPSGASLVGFPVPLRDQHLVSPGERLVDEPKGSAIIADVDGDGQNELVFESALGLLYAMEKDGKDSAGYPRKVSGGGVVSPQLYDYLDGAQPRRALLLFEAEGDTVAQGGAQRSPRLQKIELPPPPQPRADQRLAEWRGLSGSVLRQGRGVVGQGPQSSVAVANEDRGAFVYPNPAGAQLYARVRFESGGVQTASATLMNVEGQERYTTTKEITTAGTNEIDLPIETLASGPYLCRIEYLAPAGRRVEVIPLYIEH